MHSELDNIKAEHGDSMLISQMFPSEGFICTRVTKLELMDKRDHESTDVHFTHITYLQN